MKRSSLLRHLRQHGRVLKREGASHSLWMNPATGAVEAVPRHTEIANILVEQDLSQSWRPRTRFELTRIPLSNVCVSGRGDSSSHGADGRKRLLASRPWVTPRIKE